MTTDNLDEFKIYLAELFSYLKKRWGIKTTPKVRLVSDEKNAQKMLGKTAYYDPDKKTICLYIVGRWPKDVLRSMSHEVRHHSQHEKNLFDIQNQHNTSPGYAQSNKQLRKAEMDAFLQGSIAFRDWEDEKKSEDKKKNK